MQRELIRREAHRLIDCGYSVLPLRYGHKTPLLKWKYLESSHKAVDYWVGRFGSMNVAIQTGASGIVGLDADTPEASEWIAANCPRTPMVARTPSGGLHVYYRAPEDAPNPAVNLLGIGLDVRARRSLLVASPSWSVEHKRRWKWQGEIVPPSELPVLPRALIPTRPVQAPRHAMPSGERRSCGAIRNVGRWIMRVESIQGQNGSGQCFKVACRLAQSGMSWDAAWQTFLAWNDACAQPPWSEKELTHKLADAFKRFR